MSSHESGESDPLFTLYVVGRKGRLALGKKLSAAAALSLLQAQRSDILLGQELVVVDERTGAPTTEHALELAAGVPLEPPQAPEEIDASSPEGLRAGSVDQGLSPRSQRDFSPDLPGRSDQALARAQKARAEYMRVHDACLARLRAKPILGDRQIQELEWMVRAVDAQFTGAINGCREAWDNIAARRGRPPR